MTARVDDHVLAAWSGVVETLRPPPHGSSISLAWLETRQHR
jgi:hypothetical protein